MNSVLNISAYRFVGIDDPQALRDRLAPRAGELGLLGTILIAGEGINLFLAGEPETVGTFLDDLRADPRFAGLQAKESWSQRQPFRKLLVKVKREIIRMNHPAIQPAAGRAPALDAVTLKRWLDQGHDDAGRPVVTLDTRNAFEVDEGTFEGALDGSDCTLADFVSGAPGVAIDQFTITVTERGVLDLTVTASGFAPLMMMGREDTGQIVASDENYTLSSTAHIRATVPPGRYLVLLTAYEGQGTYTAKTTFTPQ